MKIISKLSGFVSAVAMVAMVVAPVSASAATSGLFNRTRGLSDLFVLDKLFANSSTSILHPGTVNLGDLYILDRLFPIQSTAVSPSVSLGQSLAGRIVIEVEKNGEAWYVQPGTFTRVYLGDPDKAFGIMAAKAVGVSNSDFDSYNGVAPTSLAGKFILKTEDGGKLYYVRPSNRTMIAVNGPAGAASLIAMVGLGITEKDINKITVAQ